jgi:hypothetical protein
VLKEVEAKALVTDGFSLLTHLQNLTLTSPSSLLGSGDCQSLSNDYSHAHRSVAQIDVIDISVLSYSHFIFAPARARTIL